MKEYFDFIKEKFKENLKKYKAHFVCIENGVMKTHITEELKQFMGLGQ